MQIHPLRVTLILNFTHFSLCLQNAKPAPISSRAREPSPRIYTGRISAFMVGSPNRMVGYPNFVPRRSNSHRFFAQTAGFGVERPNLRGVERS
ncbi:hypothetical protein AVEN_165154-1 [Araneus ventricosus]|uniref:Secreted protein n=1 Tax=Araneus ventricosus TaxID=182803 RepID=A0A4Y2B819_ARAVE|nr:hypothetical protein AVEN_165154-1 [Araneus ventricosus]